ncbi:unnamed protein product [Rotaria sp. Silwood1]|nr:unnamed protein product [Rotaria sp. Silwood1]CAF3379609.1 unnamed protein product [Rotaria sp. Silwood1]CAF4521726.1 unnamed protein product [Rotaria sp. Silwood1]
MSLFGGAASQARSRNLVEFKAGKMNLRGNTVYPDKRKGLVYLYQGNDMLMHLCWKDRSSNSAEDDLVIFPDEIEFKKVTQNTTGRVYILKWRSNSRKLFFWMQEPKEDQDEEYCKKINELLNHPPTPGFGDDISDANGSHPLQPFMERIAGGSGGASAGIDPNDLSNVLRNMAPNELASLLTSSFGRSGRGAGLIQGMHRSGGSPSRSTQPTTDSRPNTAPASTNTAGTTVTSTSHSGGSSSKSRNDGTSSSPSAAAPKSTSSSTESSGSKSGSIQLSTLANVLANLGSNATQTTEAATTTTSSSKPVIDLCNIITNDNLVPLLANKDVQEKLRAHLPEGSTIPNTEEELKESIQSPQFRQAVSAFSVALQSGELGPVLVQFGFPDDVIRAANQGDLQAFAQALEKHYKKSNEEKSSDNTMDTN